MSDDIVIRAENVSKRYRISRLAEQHTLRDAVDQAARLAWRRMRWGSRLKQDEFWALQDINFEIRRGEVVGVIGRNGAGKSTLLKVLSRITEPTTGRITLRGRVASLLEVGTGFHPELTGRDNIYLNGAILGMSRTEIRKKFDEIVAFAEVDRFLETPVKRYSSGMYVRLAFSVAAHLEPEILIVDEVLAVGDAEFQAKCIGRMNAVSQSGRTVLFVSHNMEALRSICKKGLLLEKGRVRAAGDISDVASLYLGENSETEATYPDTGKPCITGLSIDATALLHGDLVVWLRYHSPFPLSPAVAGIVLETQEGRPLFGSNMRMHPPETSVDARSGTCTLRVDKLPLHSGRYSISAWLGSRADDHDSKLRALSFAFISPRHYANRPPLHVIGPVDFDCRWESSAD